MMLPSSYPFTSDIRVLGDDGILEYPFPPRRPWTAATSAAWTGRQPPAPAPRRGHGDPVEVESARSLAPPGGLPGSTAWRPARAPEIGKAEQALAALRLSLAAIRSLERGTVEIV